MHGDNLASGYFLKHWHGQYSFARAYWINYWLILAVFGSLLSVLFVLAEDVEPIFYSRLAVFVTIVTYFIVIPWQSIGLWRSAKNSGKSIWLFVVFITVFVTLVDGIRAHVSDNGTYRKIYTYAFGLGSYGAYEVELIGESIFVRGSFEYGVSNRVKQILEENDKVKHVVLTSPGGMLSEAYNMSRIISSHNLNTFVPTVCNSACTIAFISGKRRYIHHEAKLGFHQYSTRGLKFLTGKWIKRLFLMQIDDSKFFEERGVSKAFTSQMYRAENHDIWYPKLPSLKLHGVVHDILLVP